MLRPRVIPTLLVLGRKLIKTRAFRADRYVGDPLNAVRIFNEKRADELIVLDIYAGRQHSGPNFDLVESIAGECFMPLCYGGGIRTMQDVRTLFRIGVEKVSVQTAALARPHFLSDIAREFGEQSTVVSIDIKHNRFRGPQVFSSQRRKVIRADPLELIPRLVTFGAGEILLGSVDRDGVRQGMDLQMISAVSRVSPVPVIASGGVGSMHHIQEAFDAGASGVAVGSFFVFHGPHQAVLITYPSESDIEGLLQ